MDFQGYLMKFGDKEFPNKYLVEKSYKVTPNQRLEIDSYRDANALLHRETIGNYKTKIDFNTKGNLHLEDKNIIFNVFANGLISSRERKYRLVYWDDENNAYKTGIFYMPDIDYTIKRIIPTTKDIIYEPIRIALIEY